MIIDLSLSSHLWGGRWQGLPHFPTFILTTQIFPESDRIALPLLGSLSDASLKVACFPDGCEGRKECQCLSCLLCLKLVMASHWLHKLALLELLWKK